MNHIAATVGTPFYNNRTVEALAAIQWYKNLQLEQAGLTPKERTITELMLKGLSDQEIATAVGNTVKTVKHHTSSIRDKFKVTSRAELFAHIFGMLG